MNHNYRDLTGQRFGRLVVQDIAGRDKYNRYVWTCLCDCGCVKNVASMNLVNGNTKSCGCLKKSKSTTHGMSNTRIYHIWENMKKRCNPNRAGDHKNYSDRGIRVCNEWENDFLSFYHWAINNGYQDNLTIDRIDNDKGYFPNNCRWNTYAQQSNNRRVNHYITYDGQTKTVTEWAREYGIDPRTIKSRLQKGMDAKQAITLPGCRRSS